MASVRKFYDLVEADKAVESLIYYRRLQQERKDPCNNSNGTSLLHIAANFGAIHFSEYLFQSLSQEAQEVMVGMILKKDASGETPLSMAACFGHVKVFKFLFEKLKEFSIELKEIEKNKLIFDSAMSGNLDLMKYLFNEWGPFIFFNKTLDSSETLMDLWGKVAITGIEVPAVSEVLRVWLESMSVKSLIEINLRAFERCGGKLDKPFHQATGNTLLHFAAALGSLELIETLVKINSKVLFVQNFKNLTALSVASDCVQQKAFNCLLMYSKDANCRLSDLDSQEHDMREKSASAVIFSESMSMRPRLRKVVPLTVDQKSQSEKSIFSSPVIRYY